MLPLTFLVLSYCIFAFSLDKLQRTSLESSTLEERIDYSVCLTIKGSISSEGDVYYADSDLFYKGIYHWALSSVQLPMCVVEPGTAADVGKIFGVLNQTKTPFAVKGGGHTGNSNFSSTTGVHISMYRFSEVIYNATAQTADIGAGLIWDTVYEELEAQGITVLGGRVTGLGVAGFILGGGYSWHTNQYGLSIDTVTAFELVKPDGSVSTVTQASDSQLFFGLKGGFNNFGIVTKFTMKTYPQTQIWGGLVITPWDQVSMVADANAKFASDVQDPKAAIIIGYEPTEQIISQILFYDSPTKPNDIFDSFLSIPNIVDNTKTQNFTSFLSSTPSNATAGFRGLFHTTSILSYTPELLEVIIQEANNWQKNLANKTLTFVSYDVEPFLPSIYSHNNESTAFPPNRSMPILPLAINYAWIDEQYDQDFQDAARQSADNILKAAIDQEQTNLTGAAIYPNYALFDTPLANMYGNNVQALNDLKARVDPTNLMSLAGGFKF